MGLSTVQSAVIAQQKQCNAHARITAITSSADALSDLETVSPKRTQFSLESNNYPKWLRLAIGREVASTVRQIEMPRPFLSCIEADHWDVGQES